MIAKRAYEIPEMLDLFCYDLRCSSQTKIGSKIDILKKG